MSWDADIYLRDQLVGHIERTVEGSRLVYTKEAVERPPAPGYLAWRMPFQSEPIVSEGVNLPPFLVNLLPEGVRQQLLFESHKVARDDFLGLLLLVGGDTIGDVSVVRYGEGLDQGVSSMMRFDDLSFWEEFYGQYRTGKEKGIPGVQEKISHASFSVSGKGRYASSILKLNPEKYPRLVENEAFFLKVAKSCRFAVNEWKVVHDRVGESGLLVKRFDRLLVEGEVERLHQEDMCQLVGAYPASKYSITMRSVMLTLDEVATAPLQAKLEVLMRYVFAYLMGNADLHAKNISVLWKAGTRNLTPCYDLVCTLAYPDLDRHMALPLDGKNLNFKRKDIVAFGLRFGILEKAIEMSLDQLIRRFEPWVGRFGEMGYSGEVTEMVQKECWKRVEAMKP